MLKSSVLMMQLSTYQIFSMFPYKEMTFRISIQDRTKLYYLQVEYLTKMPWSVCVEMSMLW